MIEIAGKGVPEVEMIGLAGKMILYNLYFHFYYHYDFVHKRVFCMTTCV